MARELSELFAGPIADVVVPFVASKNIVGRETDGCGAARPRCGWGGWG